MRGRSSSGAAVSGNRERRRKAKSSSPLKERIGSTSSKLSSQSELITSPSAATLLDHEPNTALSAEYSNPNSRKFADSVKKKCWEKADKVRGRDPSRWRRDPLGNLIFRKLVGCAGCLCHDYDHILPYSKSFWCYVKFRGVKARWKTVKYYRQQLIDQRVIEQISPNLILFSRVLIAGFQIVTWICWNCLLLAMFGVDKILEDVEFNEDMY